MTADRLAPALWDIQLNGRWGTSFADPHITADLAARIILAQAPLGTGRCCPTLISAPIDNLIHGVRMIAEACEDAAVASMVLGIHLEGPWISEVDGYRGAHPFEAIRDPNWADFEAIRAASGGRVVLVTLAPERPGAIAFVRRLVDSGVVVALGHTAADGPTIRAAVDAGATLSTHLGNGIASPLIRHPNPIWEQAAEDRLHASIIADGHHLDASTMKVLARAKGPDRLILVSDASPLAGLPPARHGGWEVQESGKVVVVGTPYLAGSTATLFRGVANLSQIVGLYAALAAATANPARLLGHSPPVVDAANHVRYRVSDLGIELLGTTVHGREYPAGR